MSDSAFFLTKRPKYINKPFHLLPLKQRAIFILHLAGFTQREIASLIRTSVSTINYYICRSYEKYNVENRTNAPKGRRDIRLTYVGKTSDAEYINAKVNQNPCGGGRKVLNL